MKHSVAEFLLCGQVSSPLNCGVVGTCAINLHRRLVVGRNVRGLILFCHSVRSRLHTCLVNHETFHFNLCILLAPNVSWQISLQNLCGVVKLSIRLCKCVQHSPNTLSVVLESNFTCFGVTCYPSSSTIY